MKVPKPAIFCVLLSLFLGFVFCQSTRAEVLYLQHDYENKNYLANVLVRTADNWLNGAVTTVAGAVRAAASDYTAFLGTLKARTWQKPFQLAQTLLNTSESSVTQTTGSTTLTTNTIQRNFEPIQIQVNVTGISGITNTSTLQSEIDTLQSQFRSLQSSFSQTSSSLFQVVGQSSVSPTFVTNLLTDANIPDNITVSNYLPLSGGTITGNLKVNGTCTGCGSSFNNITESGSLTGVSSSTPWGVLSVEQIASPTGGTNLPAFVVSDAGTSTASFTILNGNGNVGIGTNTPSEKFTLSGGNFFNPVNASTTPRGGIQVNNTGTTNAVKIFGNYAFLSVSPAGGACSSASINGCELAFIDVTNPSKPTFITGLDLTSGAASPAPFFDVSGRYLYSGGPGDLSAQCSPPAEYKGCNILIYDISNIASTTLKSGFLVSQGTAPRDISVVGRYMYVMIGTANAAPCVMPSDYQGCELQIYDISNKASSTFVGGVDLAADGLNIKVLGRYAYLNKAENIGTCSGTTLTGCEFSIYDISDPSSPTAVGGLNDPNNAHTFGVAGRYAYFNRISSAGTCSGPTVTGCELVIYDISNPASPTAVGGFDIGAGGGADVKISGRYLFTSQAFNSGTCSDTVMTGCEILMFDVANPSSPVFAGGANLGLDSSSLFAELDVKGRFIYAATQNLYTTHCATPEFDGCALTIFEIPGSEIGSANIGSLEAGNLQIRNDLIVSGQTKISNGLNVGAGGIQTDGSLAVSSTTVLFNSTGVASTSPWGTLSVEQISTVSGSQTNLPAFVIADQGSSTPAFLVLNGTGNAGFATTLPRNRLEVGGTAVIKGNLNVEATSTASTFNATSTINIATGTPNTLVQLAVSGNSYISGGLGIGVATTSNGGLFVKGSADIYDALTVRGGISNNLFVQGGNVGIGTSTLGSRLEIAGFGVVKGNLNIEATSTLSNLNATSTIQIATTTPTNTATSTRLIVGGRVMIGGAVSLFLDDAGDGTRAVCHSGSANDRGTAVTLTDCTGAPAADYAEMYPVAADADYGDVMVVGPETTTTKDGDEISKLVRSSQPYQGSIIGVLSNNYNDFTSAGYNLKSEGSSKPIALNGRVPVKVNLENGPINAGDPITSSSEPGIGMKATKSGRIIGYALAAFSGPTEQNKGKVLIFVYNGFYLAGDLSPTPNDTPPPSWLAQAVDTILAKVKEWFTSVKEWVLDTLTARKVAVEKLEMKDSATGQIYCVTLANGDWQKTPGGCDTPVPPANDAAPAPDSASPSPSPDNSSVPPADPATDSVATSVPTQ